jgi:hypothetical protein
MVNSVRHERWIGMTCPPVTVAWPGKYVLPTKVSGACWTCIGVLIAPAARTAAHRRGNASHPQRSRDHHADAGNGAFWRTTSADGRSALVET